MLRLIWVLMGCSMLLACSKSASESDSAAACSDLRKVQSKDDLIQQIYEHMDHQCLYEKTGPELSKIWGVAVLNNKSKYRQYNHASSYELWKNAQCHTEPEGMLVTLSDIGNKNERGFIDIQLSNCYIKKYGGFDADTRWLSRLPPAQVIASNRHLPVQKPNEPLWSLEEEGAGKPFKPMHYYVWYSKTGTAAMYIDTYISAQVPMILVWGQIEPDKKYFD
ncbi:hypothetical protein LVJ82_16505 [Vitreoscilla massiliensis]|uniref:Lipoprotein n=1 Tax=Vitreoscilla massiliensis TaxID=1689272 RepID=A0ABY4E2K3_9NEIS|nr:hypothetical protein [Vitreoscilla massiliensis]UOO89025.1 hypothetical protein LVJ82_16505 [Vitreoscilla massiliensis]